MLAPMAKLPNGPAADNDNPAPRVRPIGYVPIIGVVGGAGEVTITDPAWRRCRARSAEIVPFPSDPREA